MEKDQMISSTKVVIIGGSAGSLDVLLQLLPKLHRIHSFAIVIVVHRKSAEDTNLEDLIALKTTIPVKDVEDKIMLSPGFIYIAPSDYHLLFEKNNLLALDTSEKINHSRPSIDVSFESAADAFGSDLVGILLSGANADGTEGLIAIKKAHGITVVQQPQTAEMAFMPENAVRYANPDYVLDVAGILEFMVSIDK
ncbi:MAG TPA: chemotaxis protein CheB [Flavobacterium sp.]|nr:chemotaxis protein CheB [Flavobacterium sp.]